MCALLLCNLFISQSDHYSPEVNDPILFQLGGNHEIWHKDAVKGGEFKLIGGHPKSDVRAVSGGCLSICLLVKMKMSFSVFRFIV